jgi:hypothetical protein
MSRWVAVGRLRPGDPRQVAGFEVVGRLGEGGMGVVFLAEHPEHGPAALKLVRDGVAGDPAFRSRFRREVAAAEAVRSPRVARVLAADPDADSPWLATSFVDGPTLKEAVDSDGPMAGHRLTALAVALADALAAIHRARVVHRDLKPSNILLTPDSPVVIDFGIANLRGGPAITRTGTTIGTPGWMAPEQVRGKRSGPRADVFSWGLVVAYAASGRPPFGVGRPDAVFYRIVHEPPDLPPLAPPLGDVVRDALAKDPAGRPTVGEILERLTAGTLEVTAAGATALGPTLTDRTAVVPTIVALGWGVDALPARPGGQPRSLPPGATDVPVVPAPVPDVATGPPLRPAPPPPPPPPVQGNGADAGNAGPPATARGDAPGVPAALDQPGGNGAAPSPPAAAPRENGATFWYMGEEHRTPASLAAALQSSWDDAQDQVFRQRDPIWLGELRTFLRACDRTSAEALVAAGAGVEPHAAALARLVLAIDATAAPRVGSTWLTPEGLVAAAQAVVDGRDGGERLASLGAARILRVWRTLPGMDRAAAIDERWHAGTEAFARRAAAVSAETGPLVPVERCRASAALLLSAVHPEHDLQLSRRLDACRRTSARRQAWWAQLAADGRQDPTSAVLAVITAGRARTRADAERQAAREENRSRRESQRADRAQRRAAAAAVRPRYLPLRAALSSTRQAWALVALIVALLIYLWVPATFGEEVVAYYTPSRGQEGDPDSLDSYRDAVGATWLAVVLLGVLPAMHVLTRTLLRRGASRRVVRAYAGGAAAVDLVLGVVLLQAAVAGALVLQACTQSRFGDVVAEVPVGDDQPWAATGLLIPFGVVGVVLAVRALWRLGRVVFGGHVAGPGSPPPPPSPPSPQPPAIHGAR